MNQNTVPIVRMYTDSSGFTAFKNMLIQVSGDNAVGSIGLFSKLFTAANQKTKLPSLEMQFAVTPPPAPGEQMPKLRHNDPQEQLVITLDGCLEFTSADASPEEPGRRAIIQKGSVLLAEDRTGPGHIWQFVPDANGNYLPWVRCYIHLKEHYDELLSELEDLS